MTRLLIFVHFNPYNELSSHVLYTLKELKSLFKRIVFVSNSYLDESDMTGIQQYCDKIKIRENKGFDFGAWKDMLLDEGWSALQTYDTLTLMNDSCFGPICNMRQIYDRMEIPGIDFWGLTNHRRSKTGMPVTGGAIREHIQSYFLSFTKNVVISSIFQEFWEGLSHKKDVYHVIRQYETQLTDTLIRSGFQYKVLIDTKSLNFQEYNLATLRPDVLIPEGSPFVKVKSFLYFQHPRYLKILIERHSDYPVNLIDEHINKTYHPNVSLRILNKSIVTCARKEALEKNKLNIAIHLHVFYLDVFHKIINEFQNECVQSDLFITTDTLEKKKQIESLIQEKGKSHLLKEIMIFENRGRDILPWLEISHKLAVYDVVGHFHTKKTNSTDEWVGASWMEEIIESLILPMGEIIELFEKHRDIGIVIPDIPYYHNLVFEGDTWGNNKAIVERVWIKMNCKKSLNFNELAIPIMPYGNMFWYRPEALKPLFDLKWSIDDFPGEPIRTDGTIAHSIERLPVYIAWNQGYDFRIAMNKNNVFPGFDFKERKEKLVISIYNSIYNSIHSSYTWRMGRIFTWLPGKIKSWFYST